MSNDVRENGIKAIENFFQICLSEKLCDDKACWVEVVVPIRISIYTVDINAFFASEFGNLKVGFDEVLHFVVRQPFLTGT